MDNLETQETLHTRQRTKTNQTTQHQKLTGCLILTDNPRYSDCRTFKHMILLNSCLQLVDNALYSACRTYKHMVLNCLIDVIVFLGITPGRSRVLIIIILYFNQKLLKYDNSPVVYTDMTVYFCINNILINQYIRQ